MLISDPREKGIEKAQCAGFTKAGNPCTTLVDPERLFCYWHDPDQAERRSRVAASGGKASYKNRRNVEEIKGIQKEIRDLINKVLKGEINRASASVAISGYGVLRGYVEQERKQIEQDEVIPRVEALESARREETLEREGPPPPWGL